MATTGPQEPKLQPALVAAPETPSLPLTLLNWIDRLPAPARSAVRSRMHRRSLGAGEHIWLSGQARTGIVQILSGQITFYSGNAEGRELRYFTFGEGDCLGEDSLSGLARRHHSATAEMATSISLLSVPDFWQLAATWPEIHRELYGLYARKSKFLFDYIDSIVLDPVDVKIAGRICSILSLRRDGNEPDDKLELEISHSALADMTGVTRQTVSAVLQRWRSTGLIELHYRKLVVIRPDSIQAIWESRRAVPFVSVA